MITVVDPSLNWLFITWDTTEEPIRIDEDGRTVFALAESAVWPDEKTLELKLRIGCGSRMASRSPRTPSSMSPSEALELCLWTNGEVDIVTEVSPTDAARVRASDFARLITSDANRVLMSIINRARPDVPLDNANVRKALNLAVRPS